MPSAKTIKQRYHTKRFLSYLLTAGALVVAASSPYFTLRILQSVFREKRTSQNKKKITNLFWYLKKQRLIEVKREGRDMRIALTKKGKERAGQYQIDELEIPKPEKWDGKWRVVIFDIPISSNMVRDVFRGKLRSFGFYQLQKSIWVYPYPCQEEIELLRDFLGASRRRVQVLEVEKMEDDSFLRRNFNV